MSVETPLGLPLTDEFLDALADRVAERLADRQAEPDDFLDVDGAAAFLACPKSRIYALAPEGKIPHYRDGSRLLFCRSELRAWVERGGATRR